jgi:hypothetical protein
MHTINHWVFSCKFLINELVGFSIKKASTEHMLMYVAFKIGNVAEKTQNESYQDTVYDLMISFILLNIFRKRIQKGIQTNEAKYVFNKKASFKKKNYWL